MDVSEEVIWKYQQAGNIAAQVRDEAKRIVHEGMPIIDLCEKTESLIRNMGGKPAFPCNVSINEVAAHYTSPPYDKRTIPDKSIVKVDIGVHIDGYIVDTAVTVSFNPEYELLVQTAQEALKTAVRILRPGLFMSQFGSTIQKTIENRGFKPISNLTGHKIERYSLHAGKSLPNLFHFSNVHVDVGEVYGVEPFVTVADANGKVESSFEAHIFRFLKQKPLKSEHAKKLLNCIKKDFGALPFSERWLQQCVQPKNYEAAFSELSSSKILMSYPVFVEESGKPVAQAEHTVLIVKDGCLVLT